MRNQVPLERNIPQDTINAALARAVRAVPDGVFLDFGGDTHTFAEVDAAATRLAHGLLDAGVVPGEPVATILDNNLEAVTAWLAINKLGAISAPVNTAFKGEYLRSQLADCGARIVIAERDYGDRIAAVADALPDLRRVYLRGGAPAGTGAAFEDLAALRAPREDPIPDAVAPDTTAMLVYTSGTTGASKGCMLPHNLPCNLGWGSVRNRGIRADDVLWSPLPLFHLNAIAVTVMTGLIAQARVAVSRRFSASNFWNEIEASGATVIALLGSMATLIAEAAPCEAERRCRGRIRIVNAAPFPPEVAAVWRERFGVASASGAIGYGMTEAATIASMGPGEPPGPPGSSGHGGIDFEVAIFDAADQPLPPGQVGEIVCRPLYPNILFQGYWKRPEATLKALRNLWFHTGDYGRLDAQGFLYFVDRKKDYIRRRGENISSFELEAVFRAHEAIRDVAVHSVRSALGEDEVKVTCELKPGAAVTEEALCRWSIDRVPYFAVPLYVEFREELPRSATGKVLKEQLREEGRTARTWDREAAGVRFERR
ncbi:MAG: AMP-binding protein [Gammaproteobacteria bacterium]